MKLDIEINSKNLAKFTMSPILMMVFLSFYTLIDGFFISKYVGAEALSATNIFFPVINLFFAISFMLRSGGGAFIGKLLGEGKREEANKNFSMLFYTNLFTGIILSIFTIIFLEKLMYLLGANDKIIHLCTEYGFYCVLFSPFLFLQTFFQNFLIMDGKQKLAMILFISSGINNIVLDCIFIKIFSMGLTGAALATGLSFLIVPTFSIINFVFSKTRVLEIGKIYFNFKNLLQICENGISEMVTNLAVAFTTFFYNILLMKYVGIEGVAAITIIMYLDFLFCSVFLGYTSAISSLVSFNYGKKDTAKLKSLFKYSFSFISISSIIIFLISFIFARELSGIFVKDNLTALDASTYGLRFYSFSFLFMGLNISNSALFTALSNGKISGLFSFLKFFVFLTSCLYLLPLIFEANGIWLAKPISETMTFLAGVYFVLKHKKIYNYL